VKHHEVLIRRAIALARQARDADNHPFGALLAIDGVVILTAQNTIATDRDPIAHAESNLVAAAIRRLKPEEIRRSVLYSSCEPCAMCVGKMHWAGIRALVVRSSGDGSGGADQPRFPRAVCADLFAHAREPVAIIGPVLPGEAREVHVGFWPAAT
jgi:tRNA(Arg) A34 adenosine deaminase TadA